MNGAESHNDFWRVVMATPNGCLEPANDHAAAGRLVRRERLRGLLDYHYREAA